MRFLVDAQLPPALARLLTAQGHVAEHVHDIGLGHASDRVIWAYAQTHEAVVVTKDEDFAALVTLSETAPIVVWVRVGNTSRRALLGWFDPLVDQITAMVDAGDRLIELR